MAGQAGEGTSAGLMPKGGRPDRILATAAVRSFQQDPLSRLLRVYETQENSI